MRGRQEMHNSRYYKKRYPKRYHRYYPHYPYHFYNPVWYDWNDYDWYEQDWDDYDWYYRGSKHSKRTKASIKADMTADMQQVIMIDAETLSALMHYVRDMSPTDEHIINIINKIVSLSHSDEVIDMEDYEYIIMNTHRLVKNIDNNSDQTHDTSEEVIAEKK